MGIHPHFVRRSCHGRHGNPRVVQARNRSLLEIRTRRSSVRGSVTDFEPSGEVPELCRMSLMTLDQLF